MTQSDLLIDKILSGDCLSVLNGLPEKSVDLIFADPPCNGWEHWYDLDKQTGERVVIDRLKESVRKESDLKIDE